MDGAVLPLRVVDDEPAITRALCRALERSGLRASPAVSGGAAAEVVGRAHVDFLILDLRLPDVRGDAVFEFAVAIQPHLRRRTLFITGDVSGRARALVDACGCPFLLKPFRVQEIAEWVNRDRDRGDMGHAT